MDTQFKVLSVAPMRDWTIFHQRKLEHLRMMQKAGIKLYFVLHAEHPELPMFELGRLYQIDVMVHTDLCQTEAAGEQWAFNSHLLLSHFSVVLMPAPDRPLLGELDLNDVLTCAERWMALGLLPTVSEQYAEGFKEIEQVTLPSRRALTLDFHTREERDTPHDRVLALSKLTEMTDLVRARLLEDKLA